jgi:hypothetical protein
MLALALELSILVNSTSMSWQHACLPLKSHAVIVDVDDQVVASELCWRWCCQVMSVMLPLSPTGDGAVEATLVVA